jgi:hypothetical protein
MKSAKTLHERTVAALRAEAHRLLDELQMTGERERRRLLAVRAFELVQRAEQLGQREDASRLRNSLGARQRNRTDS